MVGETVGQYRIEERLGGGAMGVVYRAEDTRLRRPVALKFLPADLTGDPEANRRFMREARAASALDHPNICTVHEIGETPDGALYIVMPWYGGRTLKALLADGPLPAERALDLARQVAAGLAHAAAGGVVHRDVKPANLMVTDEGRVKIVDFGLALLADRRRLTRTGAAVGTAAYMAPEQIQGAEVTPAADVWALGAVLHEMLAGAPPFAGETEPALFYAILNTDPEPVPTDGTPAGELCRAIVDRCLAKSPDGRYASAALLRDDLDRASQVLTPPPGLRVSVRPTRRAALRRLAGPLLAAAALAVVLLMPSLRRPALETLGLAAPEVRGAAVLPFETGDDDPERRAFADGLARLLAERLGAMDGDDDRVWIVPAGVIETYGVATPEDARRRLGVDLTLAGRLSPAADGRLALSLLSRDAAGAPPGHAEIVDLPANLEAWQTRAPAEAAALLGLAATGDGPSGCTSVPEAFEACVRGWGWLHPREGERDPERAAAAFAEAVAADSSFARARTGLGRALWLAEGRRDTAVARAAEAHLRRAAELDTLSAWPLVYLGDVLSRTGEPADAVSAYEHALVREPGHARALKSLSRLHRRLGDDAAACAAYRRAVAARPDDVSVHVSLGFQHWLQARYDEAATCFRRQIEIAPGDHAGYDNLGAVLFEMEAHGEAREMFERSLALAPTANASANLGTLEYYRRRYGAAVDLFRRSLAMDPEPYWVWGQYADAQHWAGAPPDSSRAAWRQAVARAETALADAPDDPYLISDLASYHAHLDEADRALELLARLASQPDQTPETFFIAADACEALGRRDEALDWLERACASDLSMARIEYYPGLRELRSHPRYREMVARRGG